MHILPMPKAPSRSKPEFSLTPRKKSRNKGAIPPPSEPIKANSKGLLKPKGPKNEVVKTRRFTFAIGCMAIASFALSMFNYFQ